MEANELIIGVSVYFCCFDGSNIVVRVTGFKDGIVYGDSDKGSHWCNIEKVEPIPIIPEILEKNGWVRTKYCYGRDCMEIHGADELPEGIDNALSVARWSIDKNYQYHFLDLYMWKGSVRQHNVHYIHQLQNAFRIFGIEEKIMI